MITIHSKTHKEMTGSVNDVPYVISFDADGFAEVEEAVAIQLTSAWYGVTVIDEDGAEISTVPTAEKTEEIVSDLSTAEELASDPATPVNAVEEVKEKATKTPKNKSADGSEA